MRVGLCHRRKRNASPLEAPRPASQYATTAAQVEPVEAVPETYSPKDIRSFFGGFGGGGNGHNQSVRSQKKKTNPFGKKATHMKLKLSESVCRVSL